MKHAIFSILLVTLLACESAVADKLVITGQPVELLPAGTTETYIFPNTITYDIKAPYYYATIHNANYVCFTTEQPNFEKLKVIVTTVQVNGETVTWQCYPANANYFEYKP